jgi:hypothetical protein
MAALDAWAVKHHVLAEACARCAQALAFVVALLLVHTLGACAAVSPETVTVEVPVATRATPPAELTAPLDAAPPVFVAPTDAQATSALTPEGERRLRALLEELLARLRAWAAWAAPSPTTPGDPTHGR